MIKTVIYVALNICVEISYLLNKVNEYFKGNQLKPISKARNTCSFITVAIFFV